eukprot:CAMPEP_0114601182 /NCGR_PEP_ID=MMETSP0125-20121206/23818_1 /TAXON_ID=485358 ORGANISM="Aristerostoma sp., Strain ATCC 50986" /NCGR_SAMPLE_ID=MMETSP0125 /ASSEMBLY_ACC=CAM_ASM_000245 /LENGTH=81 /DNA_ID=CAMNT_0001810189 /DNA_START=183 /DNA_END=428 /DNA_ORIENTATION=+
MEVASSDFVDIACIIDISVSLDGDKLDLIKKSIEKLLSHLGENDRLSLITFSDKGERITPLICMSQNGKNRVLQATRTLEA